MYNKTVCLLSLVILSMPINTVAKMYKWVDNEGNTHYTQSPPLDRASNEVNPPSKVDTESAVKELEERQETLKKSEAAAAKSEEEAQKKSDELAIREENCRIAKERVNKLQNSRRIRAVDEDGNISRSSEEEQQARIDKSKEDISKYCN